jgi:hypothetical protein
MPVEVIDTTWPSTTWNESFYRALPSGTGSRLVNSHQCQHHEGHGCPHPRRPATDHLWRRLIATFSAVGLFATRTCGGE